MNEEIRPIWTEKKRVVTIECPAGKDPQYISDCKECEYYSKGDLSIAYAPLHYCTYKEE